MSEITLHFLAFVLCLLGSAFFAGMETGVVSINRLRLQHLVQRNVPAARILDEFLRGPDLLLGTTLVGTNLCHVIAGVMAASLSMRIHPQWGPVVSGFLLALILLVVGEYLPKAWFQSYPIHRTLPLAATLRFTARLLRPASWALTLLNRFLLPKARASAEDRPPLVTREELIHLADEGRRSGSLTAVESRMIHNVLEIGGRKVGEIMIPRDQMLWVDAGQPAREVLELARKKNVKQLPVWNDDKKTFDRTVNIFEILLVANIGDQPISFFAKPAQIVSIRESIEHIMPRMRISRQPMMLVVNERLDVIGLITIEDVLREIVGES